MNVQEILEALSSSDIVLETSIIILILEPGTSVPCANADPIISAAHAIIKTKVLHLILLPPETIAHRDAAPDGIQTHHVC